MASRALSAISNPTNLLNQNNSDSPSPKTMSFNLIVDQGNSACKVAFVRNNSIESISFLQGKAGQALSHLVAPHRFDKAVYSSVGLPDEEAETIVRSCAAASLMMGTETPVPLRLQYDRRTLGADRLAAVVGAHSLYPNTELLVIDAGTAITYERVSAEGIYLGGNISPGLHLRFKALHLFTGRLPLIDPSGISPKIAEYGSSTEEAIAAGVIHGLAGEIDRYIDDLHAKEGRSAVILTGGDANYLARIIRSGILIHPDLVLLGLNRILEYNV